MTKSLIGEIVRLVREGWRPYMEKPHGAIYEKLRCEQVQKKGGKKPYWFHRADIFLCIGCDRRCCLSRPEGFIRPLPIQYQEDPAQPYTLTPMQMLERRKLMLVQEAAYCLNVSERTIYAWIAEGVLRVTRRRPYRIPVEDVAGLMSDLDE